MSLPIYASFTVSMFTVFTEPDVGWESVEL